MKNRASVVIESFIVFLVIICSIFIAIPFVIKSNHREEIMVKWAQKYKNIQYAYEVLAAQSEQENKNVISSSLKQRMEMLLRVEKDVTSKYSQYFLNKNEKNDTYVFDKFYLNQNGIVLGFKWLNQNCIKDQICAVMTVDINGLEKPNVWGEDVFGVDIYNDKIKPSGSFLRTKDMKKDCSKKGSGVYCSAYYLIGGIVE